MAEIRSFEKHWVLQIKVGRLNKHKAFRYKIDKTNNKKVSQTFNRIATLNISKQVTEIESSLTGEKNPISKETLTTCRELVLIETLYGTTTAIKIVDVVIIVA